jgi:hypothetical protein
MINWLLASATDILNFIWIEVKFYCYTIKCSRIYLLLFHFSGWKFDGEHRKHWNTTNAGKFSNWINHNFYMLAFKIGYQTSLTFLYLWQLNEHHMAELIEKPIFHIMILDRFYCFRFKFSKYLSCLKFNALKTIK